MYSHTIHPTHTKTSYFIHEETENEKKKNAPHPNAAQRNATRRDNFFHKAAVIHVKWPRPGIDDGISPAPSSDRSSAAAGSRVVH